MAHALFLGVGFQVVDFADRGPGGFFKEDVLARGDGRQSARAAHLRRGAERDRVEFRMGGQHFLDGAIGLGALDFCGAQARHGHQFEVRIVGD